MIVNRILRCVFTDFLHIIMKKAGGYTTAGDVLDLHLGDPCSNSYNTNNMCTKNEFGLISFFNKQQVL